MRKSNLILSMAIIASASACTSPNKIVYPAAPQDDTVDEYVGVKVADPYRPLENDTAAETQARVEAENAVTNEYLSKIPFRGALRHASSSSTTTPRTAHRARCMTDAATSTATTV